MNTISDVDLNSIPDDVLLSLPSDLGAQSFALDPQQQHLSVQHQVPPLPSPLAQHPLSQQQYAQPQQHCMQQQSPHLPQPAHFQPPPQQQPMHHGSQQQPQQYTSPYYSQNYGQPNQRFPPLAPSSYPYQPQSLPPPPSSFHSSQMHPLHNPSHGVRNSSADILPIQSSSLPSMAHQNHPPFSPNRHHTSPSSQIPSSPSNPNYNIHHMNRAINDTGVDQSYFNLEQLPSQDIRQLKNPSDKPVQQSYSTKPVQQSYSTSTRIPQGSNATPQSPNSANINFFERASPASRHVMKRSNSLNNPQMPPNQQRPYPVGNSLPSSMPQPNNYTTDPSNSYPQGRLALSSSSSNNTTPASSMSLQSRRLSNPMPDGLNNMYATYLDLDNPFLVPAHQNHAKSSTGSRVPNPATEYVENSVLAKVLSTPNTLSLENNYSQIPALVEVSSANSKRVSSHNMNSAYNPALISDINRGHPNTVKIPNSSPSYRPRYPPSPVAASPPNNLHQSVMAAPGVAPPVRAAAPRRGTARGRSSSRGAPSTRGSPSSRGSETTPNRGAARGGATPRGRGSATTRGQWPPPAGAPSTRGVSARGQAARGAARGVYSMTGQAPSGRGAAPMGRGGAPPAARGAPPAIGMPPSRGVIHSSRGPHGSNARSTRGRGRAQQTMVTESRIFHGMELLEAETPVGNPIQWYRMPDPATPSVSGFQSDIEAMRASMTYQAPTPAIDSAQNRGQRINRDQLKPQSRVDNSPQVNDNGRNGNTSKTIASAPEAHRSEIDNQTQAAVKAATMRMKQERVDESVQASMSAKRNESSLSSVGKNINNKPPGQVENISSQNISSQNQAVKPPNRPPTNQSDLESRPSNDVIKEVATETHTNQQIDRKPFISARDRVFSLWQAGQVVGRAAKVKPKAKPLTGPSTPGNQAQGLDHNDKRRGVSENTKDQSEVPKKQSVSGDSTWNGAENSNHNLFYVLFHGHKLICLSSGNSNTVLVCQFQNECFADKGKGMVSNCINKALRIKKKVLDHPNKEVIINFLKNNGYLRGVLQHEPVHVMSLDDARRVYHFIYNIKNCSTATCVVEVLNQSVDLNIVISPSKRKILTQEMKMRIKREKKQMDDEPYGRLSNPPTSSHGSKLSADRNKSTSGSDRSDQTLAYGHCEDDDDSDDVVIVEGPEDPYLLKWDGKQSKPGCVCNTIVGQVRSYHHEGDNYLVVSDLCRILGTSEFMTGIETDNVILYSCSKDILSFLNELSKDFPQLDTGQNCLVKEKDVGVHATDDDDNDGQNLQSEMNRIAPGKRPLCKQEVVDGDEDEVCSDPKQRRLSTNDGVKSNKAAPAPSSTREVTNASSLNIEMNNGSQSKTTHSHSAHSNTTKESNESRRDGDDCNVIIEFDTSSINMRKDKSSSETILNNKSDENPKDPKSATGLSSPDSCLSILSQDGPQSPTVLRQQKDFNPPAKVTETSVPVSVNNQQTANSQTPAVVENETRENSSSNQSNISEVNSSAKSQTVRDHTKNEEAPAVVESKAEEAQSKKVVATVIDINHLTNTSNKSESSNSPNKACDRQSKNPPSTTQNNSLPTVDVNRMKSKTPPTDQDLLSRLTTFKGLPVSRIKCAEDDSELGKLHVTSLEGLEEYRSRGSLLKEMEVLRFKNKTLQETLKALRDQLKKSKAEHEKSEKLATYYGSVIQEITATFKDGDKVPGVSASPGMSASPICIDDDDD